MILPNHFNLIRTLTDASEVHDLNKRQKENTTFLSTKENIKTSDHPKLKHATRSFL